MRIRLLAIGLIAGFLAACTGGGGGDPTPTPSPSTVSSTAPASTSTSPVPSPSGPLTTGPNVRPGEKPPMYPLQVHQRTAAGALQMGGFYYKALDWSIATNDDSLVRRIATSDCRSCRLVYSAIAGLRARHEIQLGGRISIRSASVTTDRLPAHYDYAVQVTYDEGAATLVAKDGSRRTSSKAVRGAIGIVFLRWVAGEWRVSNVTSA